MSTLQAAPHPALPHSISEPLPDLAYDLTVIYGLRLRLVTRHGHDVPIHAAPRPARGSPLDELTASNREVADWLSLSAKTVESHLSRIYRKLGVRSRAGVAYLVGQAKR